MKTEIKPYPLIHPTTIVVVGTMYDKKANFTTIGDVAVAGLNPPLVMISLHEHHMATKALEETQICSINMTTKTMMKQVDFAGIYSSKNNDKSSLFDHEIKHDVPLITSSPIQLIVSVLHRTQVKQRVIFICEVKHTFINEELLKEQTLDLSNIQPLLYGLDNKYYSGIEVVGEGYKEGVKND